MTCAKSHFFMYGYDVQEDEMRMNLQKADNCPDYGAKNQREDEPK